MSRSALNRGMVRIVIGGDGLYDYASTGIADEFARLYFPDPETGSVGHPDLPASISPATATGRYHSEVYTIRAFCPVKSEIVIDFVVHEGGKASEWAQNAQSGGSLVLTSPHGLYLPPSPGGRQLALCDATGLPALARILETLPEDAHCLAIVEIADPSHRYDLRSPGRLETIWLEGGNGVSPSRLAAALRALPQDTLPYYVWMAGEQKAARAVRRHLRQHWRLPAEKYAVVGYWIENREKWMAAWDGIEPALKQRIDAAWASGRDRDGRGGDISVAGEPCVRNDRDRRASLTGGVAGISGARHASGARHGARRHQGLVQAIAACDGPLGGAPSGRSRSGLARRERTAL
ncbi:siderophore-interacting protein [Pseudochelatococcus sp.]|uniref:siderophore-interacting protein n=1 Tax=Pseudochelatococcus sp. TaxID=2020869 RepID=UPI003D910EB4